MPAPVSALAFMAILWTWPSALFLPVITGTDTTTTRIISVGITLVVSAVVMAISVAFVRGAIRPPALTVVMTLITAVGLTAVAVYFMLVDAGQLSGLGGDRGQALDIALERLLAGEYPYAALTYDGGRITPLPGGLILALPSYLLSGTSALMVFYLTPLSIWLAYRVDPRLGGILTIALFAAPAFWADVLSDGDLVITTVFAFAVAAFVLNRAMISGRAPVVASVLLGVAAATRVTSVIVIVLVVAVLAGRRRVRAAVQVGVLASAVALLVSLPFYVADPEEFSPLHTGKFIQGPAGLALAAVFVVALVGLVIAKDLWGRWPATGQLALVSSIFAVGITAIPMVVAYSDVSLFTTGYAVLALVAPLAALRGIEDTLSAGRRNDSPQGPDTRREHQADT